MKNIGIKLFFAGLVLLSAASLGYKLYPNEGGGRSPAVEADITVTTITPPLEKTESDRPEAAPSLGKTPNVNPVFLKYESQYIDTDALTPTVCFRFSEVLDPKKQPQYNDFIDVILRGTIM